MSLCEQLCVNEDVSVSVCKCFNVGARVYECRVSVSAPVGLGKCREVICQCGLWGRLVVWLTGHPETLSHPHVPFVKHKSKQRRARNHWSGRG